MPGTSSGGETESEMKSPTKVYENGRDSTPSDIEHLEESYPSPKKLTLPKTSSLDNLIEAEKQNAEEPVHQTLTSIRNSESSLSSSLASSPNHVFPAKSPVSTIELTSAYSTYVQTPIVKPYEHKRLTSPSPAMPHISQVVPVMHEKMCTAPHYHLEPPAKMPRRDEKMDVSMMRHQQLQYLDLLSRLFPEQKRDVIELILKGCNGDVVQAIECVLPSHEKAVKQMTGQIFPPPSVKEGESSRHRLPPHVIDAPNQHSAFTSFDTSQPQSHNQPRHGYTMVPVHACPPGCTCQLSEKCACADCMPSSGEMPHVHKQARNGASSRVPAPLSPIGSEISTKERSG